MCDRRDTKYAGLIEAARDWAKREQPVNQLAIMALVNALRELEERIINYENEEQSRMFSTLHS